MKCQGDVWCDFNNLNLEHPVFDNLKGVYIIWSNKITVRIGSGIIKDRIKAHRIESEINSYPNLKVVWAEVEGNKMRNVEKYLADNLNPAIGERFPDVKPIEVNLPW